MGFLEEVASRLGLDGLVTHNCTGGRGHSRPRCGRDCQPAPVPYRGDGLVQTPLPLKAQPPPECGRHCQHGALVNCTPFKGRALIALLPTSTMESAVMSFFGFL